jgi:glycosyltransferase involved in cell wall biosynthesis
MTDVIADVRTPVAEPERIEPLRPLPFPLEARSGARPRLAVVIPACNEEQALPKTYSALREVLDRLEADWSVLFVNDGSRDGTVGVLESLFRCDRRVGYVLLSRNFGHQAALTAGLDHVDADVVVSMDADMQHPPELLATLLEAWRQGYDVVHTRKLATVGLTRGRAAATALAYRLVKRVSQVEIIPQASDYRLLDRSVVEAIRSLPERSRLYRGLTPWVGFRQCVVPYVAAERAAGRSQYTFRQLLALFSRALFDFSTAPLHAGLVVGGVSVVLSALYLIYVVARFFIGGDTPPGWASIVSVTLFLNSVALAFMGIIGVYVARIYNEVRARPPYVLGRVRVHAKSAAPE